MRTPGRSLTSVRSWFSITCFFGRSWRAASWIVSVALRTSALALANGSPPAAPPPTVV